MSLFGRCGMWGGCRSTGCAAGSAHFGVVGKSHLPTWELRTSSLPEGVMAASSVRGDMGATCPN